MKNNALQLSIIVPVYNAQDYLEECLNALMAQGMDETDYEVICINDGATDDSQKILEAYATRFPQLKILLQENQGVSTTRNNGIATAAGDYIAFVDADDVPVKNAFKSALELCYHHDADLLYFDYYQGKAFFEDESQASETCEIVKEPVALTCVWRQIIKRKFLQSNHLTFDRSLKIGEDLWFNEKMLCYNPKVMHYHKNCYFYRNHISCWQSNTPEATQKKMTSMLQIASLCNRFLSENQSLEDKHRERLLDRQADCIAAAIIYSLSLPSDNTVDLIDRLQNEGLYPYAFRKYLLRQKMNKTNLLKFVLRYKSVVKLCVAFKHKA